MAGQDRGRVPDVGGRREKFGGDQVNCVVCSTDDRRSLPVPSPGQSVTTSGIIIAEPLEREQCIGCGLLQRKDRRFVGGDPFYEAQYQTYYARPGVERVDLVRYVAMSDWTV